MNRSTGMRLVLAAVVLLVGAGPGWAKPLQTKTITTADGECKSLSIFGRSTPSECDSSITFAEFRDGRVGIAFHARSGRYYWLSGMKSKEIEPNEDTIIMPVDGVRVAGDRDGKDQKAVGMCRYGNPFLGSVHVLCQAETEDGPIDAEFTTDGKQPR